MLINHTVAENNWHVFGLRPHVFIYAMIIGLASYLGFHTRYRNLVTTMFCICVVMRLLYSASGEELFHLLSFSSLAIIFVVAGASIYGSNPTLLHKQFMVYFVLCIPIMLLQMMGVSQFVQGWNIAYAHVGNVLTSSEIGTFKEVPLYPTLFAGADTFPGSIGQTRPVGLMYGSNPLSVFVSIFITLNLAIKRTYRLRFSDIVVTAMIVLTMSRLVFGVTIIIYLFFLIFGMRQRRILVLKLLALVAMGLLLYYTLFPGLFLANFNTDVVMISIMLRLGDLWRTMGFAVFRDTVNELSLIYQPHSHYIVDELILSEEKSTSSVTMFLKSDLLIIWFSIIIFGFLRYVYQVRNIKFHNWRVYIVTLFACIMTQFAVPFHGSVAFQLIIGFSLFPFFNKLWLNYSYSRRIIK